MNRHRIWIVLLGLYAMLIFVASSLSLPTGGTGLAVAHADKLIHAGEFALFFFLAWKATRHRPWLSLGISCGYAILDELHQLFVPLRHASLLDLAADGAGILVMFVGLLVLEGVLSHGKRGRILGTTSSKPGD